jgi:hypothetical protein
MLGNGTPTQVNSVPMPIKGLDCKVVQLSGGQDFSAALDDQGQVYTWGSAGFHGGHNDHLQRLLPKRIDILAGKTVFQQLATGDKVTIALTGTKPRKVPRLPGKGGFGGSSSPLPPYPYAAFLLTTPAKPAAAAAAASTAAAAAAAPAKDENFVEGAGSARMLRDFVSGTAASLAGSGSSAAGGGGATAGAASDAVATPQRAAAGAAKAAAGNASGKSPAAGSSADKGPKPKKGAKESKQEAKDGGDSKADAKESKADSKSDPKNAVLEQKEPGLLCSPQLFLEYSLPGDKNLRTSAGVELKAHELSVAARIKPEVKLGKEGKASDAKSSGASTTSSQCLIKLSSAPGGQTKSAGAASVSVTVNDSWTQCTLTVTSADGRKSQTACDYELIEQIPAAPEDAAAYARLLHSPIDFSRSALAFSATPGSSGNRWCSWCLTRRSNRYARAPWAAYPDLSDRMRTMLTLLSLRPPFLLPRASSTAACSSMASCSAN